MDVLILSLLCSIFSAFIPLFVKLAMNWMCRVSKEELFLQSEATSLKKQMDGISMVDEFSKYAKLQRKLIKVKDELKQRATSRLSTLMRNKFIFTWILHIVMGVVLICIVWLYRSVPVVVFSEGRLWPITDIVSWPTGVTGGVSVAVWICVANKVARSAASYVKCRVFAGNKNDGAVMENSMKNMESSFFLKPFEDELQ